MSNKKTLKAAVFCNIAIIVFEIIGVIISAFKNGPMLFFYYTQNSNIFAGIVSLLFIVYAIPCVIKNRQTNLKPIPRFVHALRFFTTCCLSITFLVVVFVLTPNPESGGIQRMFFGNANFFMHLTCPLLSSISFIFFENPKDDNQKYLTFTNKYILYSLIPSLIYASFLYPANALRIFRGPYPFLLILDMPIWQSIAWFVGLLVFFALIGYVYIRLNNRKIRT